MKPKIQKVFYVMKCGCSLLQTEVVKKCIPGTKITAVRCPKHEDGWLSHRKRKCCECDTFIFQYDPRPKVADRCDPHRAEDRRIKARDRARKKYIEQQAAKGLKVNHKNGTVTEIEIKPKIEYSFKSPKCALTLEQAIIKGVACIPLRKLFDFRDMISRGMI